MINPRMRVFRLDADEDTLLAVTARRLRISAAQLCRIAIGMLLDLPEAKVIELHRQSIGDDDAEGDA